MCMAHCNNIINFKFTPFKNSPPPPHTHTPLQIMGQTTLLRITIQAGFVV